jgi:hypothetical protein
MPIVTVDSLPLVERQCAEQSVPEPALDAARLLATLTQHDVRFVVIGGLAAVLHGAPYQTVDCDIVPEESADNLTRLSAALRVLDARVWTGTGSGLPFEHNAASLRDARTWNLVTDCGLLDVTFEPAGIYGYSDVAREAITVDVDGVRFAVAALADVVRSKQAAGREKDERVLPLLRRMLAEGLGLGPRET